MTKETKTVELQETELDNASGGWIIIASMGAPVRDKRAPQGGTDAYIADDGATQIRHGTPA